MSGYNERGPVPKRDVARRRRNKTDDAGHSVEVEQVELDPEEFPAEYERPAANPSWHPAARAIWDGAVDSGVTVFWEPSDWAILGLTCSQISQEYADDLIIEKVKQPLEAGSGGGEKLVYGSRPMPAGKFTAIMRTLGSLGLTEGDRRRMHMELNRFADPETEATPESIEADRLTLLQGGRSDASAG